MDVRVDESVPVSFVEDVPHEAEELKHVPAPVLGPSPKWTLTMSLICHFGAVALRVFVAGDFLWVITKSPRRRRRQNRF